MWDVFFKEKIGNEEKKDEEEKGSWIDEWVRKGKGKGNIWSKSVDEGINKKSMNELIGKIVKIGKERR